MKLPQDVVDELVVRPGRPAGLSSRSTAETSADWLGGGADADPRALADGDLEAFRTELATSQELLYASDGFALLVIVQGLDASGKDGTISHVMSGVNPQGCDVVSFKTPTAEELTHDFLWRCERVLPARGRIGIFNRSYYEEVLVTRVHPEVIAAEHLPSAPGKNEQFWQERFEDINAFEQHLHRNGTRIVKFFLHVSKDEQRQRLLERLDDPKKFWKFSSADLAERPYFEQYLDAYEAMLTATSTPWAPWYVVPADHKHAARALVGGVLVHAIEQLDLRIAEPTADERAQREAARRALLKS